MAEWILQEREPPAIWRLARFGPFANHKDK
jgi:hypothetical protein